MEYLGGCFWKRSAFDAADWVKMIHPQQRGVGTIPFMEDLKRRRKGRVRDFFLSSQISEFLTLGPSDSKTNMSSFLVLSPFNLN